MGLALFAVGCTTADDAPAASRSANPPPGRAPPPGPAETTEPAAAPEPSAPELPPAAALRPQGFTTTIRDGAFEHPRLDVGLHATITWRNLDGATHSVIGADGFWVGSGPIPPGGEFSQTFQTPGDYGYFCRYHPDMRGLVVVR